MPWLWSCTITLEQVFKLSSFHGLKIKINEDIGNILYTFCKGKGILINIWLYEVVAFIFLKL